MKSLLPFLFFFLLASLAIAQHKTVLFAPLALDASGAGLTQEPSLRASDQALMLPSAAARHRARLKSKSVGRHWFGQTHSLKALLSSDRPTMYLPHQKEEAAFRITYEEQVNDIRVVYGELLSSGHFAVYESSEGIGGYINTSGMTYTIYPANARTSVMYETKVTQEDFVCSQARGFSPDLPSERLSASLEKEVTSASEVSVVDLAVAFTPRAVARVEPAAEAAMIVSQMNQVLANSLVDNLRYRLAGVVELESQVEFLTTDITDIRQTAALEEVQAIYETYGADQVQVIVDLGSGEGNQLGTSELRNTPATRDLTIATSEALPFYFNVHELGHNHGCKHDITDIVGGPGELKVYARGFNGVNVETVMTPGSSNVIPYFSNPSIMVEGEVIGVLNERDNARQLRESAAFVASLREPVDSVPDLSPVASSGVGRTEAEAMDLDNYQTRAWFTASDRKLIQAVSLQQGTSARYRFTGEAGQYDITVRYLDEPDGQSTFTLITNDATTRQWEANEVTEGSNQWKIQTVSDVFLGSNSIVEVRAGPDRGEFARLDYVEVQPAAPTSSVARSATTNHKVGALSSDNPLRIYPNPVSDGSIRIDNVTGTEPLEEVWVMNSQGKVLLRQPTQGALSIELNVRSLPSGIYLLKTLGGQVSTRKLIIP